MGDARDFRMYSNYCCVPGESNFMIYFNEICIYIDR